MDSDTNLMGKQMRFQTTRWNLVRSASDRHSLDELITLYWKPLYFYVRQHGYDNETAKDIVQGFLTGLLERRAILKADPARGRFRTFLLSALSNYLKDWSKAGGRRKRGGGQATLSLDFARGEREYSLNGHQGESPELLLNRAWAMGLWERSLRELTGTPEQLQAFSLYRSGKDYRTISMVTGLTEPEVAASLRRLKLQLKSIITSHIRETVSSSEELDAELAEFKSLLSWRARIRQPASA